MLCLRLLALLSVRLQANALLVEHICIFSFTCRAMQLAWDSTRAAEEHALTHAHGCRHRRSCVMHMRWHDVAEES